MNVKQLKALISGLPDDTLVLQETGDHNLYEPQINVSATYIDSDYGMIEDYSGNIPDNKPALIIR